MTSNTQINNFKRKVFCMNSNPPVEVSQLDHALLDLSVKLKPNERTLAKHRSYAQTIAEVLRQNSNYDIDRFMFAGSFGKKTNLLKSDADCVYFINDQRPPFDKILKEFYGICSQSAVKNMFNSFSTAMNKNSIKFRINDLEMDVVLATNFVKDLKKGQSLAHVQQRHVLKQIQIDPTENCHKYSSSLAESTVAFMKTRVGFANEMARIAKNWYKSLDFEYISGASTFIELVAVYAARKGRRGKRKYNPYLKAFIRFLEMLVHFEKLNVAFNRCNAMFKEHSTGRSSSPRVIDPVNPYNDFTRYWRGEDVVKIKASAAETIAQLRNIVLHSSAVERDLLRIFSNS